ncbi:MAG: glycosyltransferase [Thalassobaculum sp.]|uniref:glycosyltransferase n=1 Tax=Thalassobaculum sp. TaxID=2022740 RepID=UPI0032EFFAE0
MSVSQIAGVRPKAAESPRIAVLCPREINNVVNAGTRALIDGLRHYAVAVEVFDTWTEGATGLRRLLGRRFDAVYAVAGSQLVDGPDRWNVELLDLVNSPILYRLTDPPFVRRYLGGLEGLRHAATVSVRDLHCGEYLERIGIGARAPHYHPGRYDDSGIDRDAAGRSLQERDIPFLFVGSVYRAESIEQYTRALLPDRLQTVRDLSDALLAEPSRPAWRVAEDVFRARGDELVPYHGLGRALLDLANRHANARFRCRLADLLVAHEGVIVVGDDSRLPDSPTDRRAEVLGHRTHAQVVDLMLRARLVVAAPPNFCVGAVSERVYWAMAAGAVSLSLQTPAMDRHFEPGLHYRPFDRAFADLETTLVIARESPAAFQMIADAGRRQVRVEFSNRDNVRRLFGPILDIGDPITPASAS